MWLRKQLPLFVSTILSGSKELYKHSMSVCLLYFSRHYLLCFHSNFMKFSENIYLVRWTHILHFSRSSVKVQDHTCKTNSETGKIWSILTTFQNYLDFGYNLLNFLIWAAFWLSEIGQSCDFRAFCGKHLGRMVWNLMCWCILTTLRIYYILVIVCWFLYFLSYPFHGAVLIWLTFGG